MRTRREGSLRPDRGSIHRRDQQRSFRIPGADGDAVERDVQSRDGVAHLARAPPAVDLGERERPVDERDDARIELGRGPWTAEEAGLVAVMITT